MINYTKLIFVCMDNLCQSPMAEAIMKNINRVEGLEISSRGLIVLFPEPYNPKACSLLMSNGIILENGQSKQLCEDDFGPETLILTMNRDEKKKLLEDYGHAANVYTIMEFAGGSGDILDPYGADLEVYSMFLESIQMWVKQVEEILYQNSLESKEEETK
ncbi:MAG: protein tyrosine phosphatase [Butyrivibrio sp.]